MKRLTPGSVIVLDVDGFFGALLYLASHRGGFGPAFGVFHGLWSIDQVAASGWNPEVFKAPVFPDLPGKSAVVTNRKDLIERFERPGILHEQTATSPLSKIHPFGMIEYTDNTTRNLAANERSHRLLLRVTEG